VIEYKPTFCRICEPLCGMIGVPVRVDRIGPASTAKNVE
jgi:hypothetical protein